MSLDRPPLRVALSGDHHEALKRHLFPGDGKEAVAFALCGFTHRSEFDLLTIFEVMPVPHNECSVRTPGAVAWPGTSFEPVLMRAMAEGWSVVKLHSHPTGYPDFSSVDDDSDTVTFETAFAWLDIDTPQASMVMLPDGSMFGRQITPDGLGQRLERIRVAGDDFLFWPEPIAATDVPESARRIAQTFGDTTFARLKSLRVGVVGASGTGSVVIELLARNMIGELVLVDPDRVELKNLNRIVNSTHDDAEVGASKLAVQARAIGAMKMGTRVISFDRDLLDLEVLQALSTCDVLFGCMDSVDGRHVLNKLASSYLIPYIDVGVRLDADGDGGIESIWNAVHTVLPGRSSLFSRGVYSQADLDAAFLQRTDPSRYAEQLASGYIKNAMIDRPAVISVNVDAAATAVNELLARLHPYRILPNSDFAVRRSSLSDPDASFHVREGDACPVMRRHLGSGDLKPMLGMPLLEATK